MTSDFTDVLLKLQKKVESLTLAKVKAEAAKEEAEKRLNEVTENLRSKFNVDNVSKAKELLAKLREQASKAADKIERELSELEKRSSANS